VKVDDRPSDPDALRDIANSPEVQAEARDLAKDIQRDARRLAPRRRGNLARHIEVEEITDLTTGIEGYAVGWGDKAFYGPFVEDGGEGRTPRPHLVPAAIRNGALRGGDR
jgi:HK97 gp10 family phage protein